VNPEGTVASETQAGRTTTFTYDNLFRITRTDPPGGTNFILTNYNNSDGSTVTVQRGPSTITTTLDGFGRPTLASNNVGIQTRTAYDAEGRKTYEGYPFTGTDRGTEIAYDALGRVVRHTNPDTTFHEVTYGPGSVTSRDENGHETVHTNQAFGDPDDVRLFQVRDADQKTWAYTYNALGKLTGVQAPDGTTRSWTYDSRNLLTSETHPESGTVTYNSYDAAGNLLRKTDARGTGFVYGYDGNDRVTTLIAGGQFASMTYEPGSDRRRSATVGAASATFTYDAAGRLASRDDVIDGLPFVRVFEYDGNDNLTGITYASGRHVTMGRDGANRITQIRDESFSRDIATAFGYHPSGGIETYTSGNGIVNQMTYHPQRYWPTSITAGPLGLTYDLYDAVGNVKAIGDSRGAGFGQSFDYDVLDRLRTVVGPYGSQVFEYDAHGNQTTVSGTSYQYQSLRLINRGGLSYSYDNNGNLTAAPNETYTYTPDNMLESATRVGSTSTYQYDADTWRIKAVTPDGTTYFLRGPHGELLTEIRGAGTPSVTMKDYIYAGDKLIAVIAIP
jgi:YD repeat-containing protein